MTHQLPSDFAKAKTMFQQRAVLAALGVNQPPPFAMRGVR